MLNPFTRSHPVTLTLTNVIFVALIFLGGLWFTVNFLRSLVGGLSTLRWTETTGTIVAFRLDDVVEVGAGRRRRQATKGRYYRPSVTYEYDALGERRKSRQYSAGRSVLPRTLAEDAQVRFPIGAQVPVYFHPGKPDQAVLARGPRGDEVVINLLGAAVFTGLFLVFGHLTGYFRIKGIEPDIAPPRQGRVP